MVTVGKYNYHSWIVWVASCQIKNMDSDWLQIFRNVCHSLAKSTGYWLYLFFFSRFPHPFAMLGCENGKWKRVESAILMTTWNHVWSAERFWRNSKMEETQFNGTVHLWSNHMQTFMYDEIYMQIYTCVCILKSKQKQIYTMRSEMFESAWEQKLWVQSG